MPTFDRPGMNVPPEIRRRFTRRLSVDGLKIKVQLLPALWIKAPFYGIMVTAGRDAATLSLNRGYARATKADFDRLVGRIRTAPCRASGCRRRILLGERTAQTNPESLCPPHQEVHWATESKREKEEFKAREAREDARARARGMRYKAWIWIHRDGDDVAVWRYFSKRPTTAQLAGIARAHRSKMLGDWSVERH